MGNPRVCRKVTQTRKGAVARGQPGQSQKAPAGRALMVFEVSPDAQAECGAEDWLQGNTRRMMRDDRHETVRDAEAFPCFGDSLSAPVSSSDTRVPAAGLWGASFPGRGQVRGGGQGNQAEAWHLHPTRHTHFLRAVYGSGTWRVPTLVDCISASLHGPRPPPATVLG